MLMSKGFTEEGERGKVSFNPDAQVLASEFIEPSGVVAFGLQDEYPSASELPEGVAFRILPGGIAVSDGFVEDDSLAGIQVVPSTT